MTATAKINNLKSAECKTTLIRNLSRILDIRILDINIENGTVSLVYNSISAFEKARRELDRIGLPISQCKYQLPVERSDSMDYQEKVVTF